MITKLSHVSVFVLDQESAREFYVDKLGLEVRTDMKMDSGFRWLTVGPKAQPDLEIVLMATTYFEDAEVRSTYEGMLRDGKFGAGVFETDDCRATYEELKAKGVRFKSEPEEQFYGIEAIMTDDSGNWFSLTQRKPH